MNRLEQGPTEDPAEREELLERLSRLEESLAEDPAEGAELLERI